MFNQKQIEELLKNNNIISCSPKSITFSGDFKLRAVRRYYDDGYSPKMIFEEAGLDLNVVSKNKAKECLTIWRRIYNKKGEKELMREKRGENSKGKPKIEFKSDKEKIKYLEAKVAYMDAENDFLAKLRGLKRK